MRPACAYPPMIQSGPFPTGPGMYPADRDGCFGFGVVCPQSTAVCCPVVPGPVGASPSNSINPTVTTNLYHHHIPHHTNSNGPHHSFPPGSNYLPSAQSGGGGSVSYGTASPMDMIGQPMGQPSFQSAPSSCSSYPPNMIGSDKMLIGPGGQASYMRTGHMNATSTTTLAMNGQPDPVGMATNYVGGSGSSMIVPQQSQPQHRLTTPMGGGRSSRVAQPNRISNSRSTAQGMTDLNGLSSQPMTIGADGAVNPTLIYSSTGGGSLPVMLNKSSGPPPSLSPVCPNPTMPARSMCGPVVVSPNMPQVPYVSPQQQQSRLHGPHSSNTFANQLSQQQTYPPSAPSQMFRPSAPPTGSSGSSRSRTVPSPHSNKSPSPHPNPTASSQQHFLTCSPVPSSVSPVPPSLPCAGGNFVNQTPKNSRSNVSLANGNVFNSSGMGGSGATVSGTVGAAAGGVMMGPNGSMTPPGCGIVLNGPGTQMMGHMNNNTNCVPMGTDAEIKVNPGVQDPCYVQNRPMPSGLCRDQNNLSSVNGSDMLVPHAFPIPNNLHCPNSVAYAPTQQLPMFSGDFDPVSSSNPSQIMMMSIPSSSTVPGGTLLNGGSALPTGVMNIAAVANSAPAPPPYHQPSVNCRGLGPQPFFGSSSMPTNPGGPVIFHNIPSDGSNCGGITNEQRHFMAMVGNDMTPPPGGITSAPAGIGIAPLSACGVMKQQQQSMLQQPPQPTTGSTGGKSTARPKKSKSTKGGAGGARSKGNAKKNTATISSASGPSSLLPSSLPTPTADAYSIRMPNHQTPNKTKMLNSGWAMCPSNAAAALSASNLNHPGVMLGSCDGGPVVGPMAVNAGLYSPPPMSSSSGRLSPSSYPPIPNGGGELLMRSTSQVVPNMPLSSSSVFPTTTMLPSDATRFSAQNRLYAATSALSSTNFPQHQQQYAMGPNTTTAMYPNSSPGMGIQNSLYGGVSTVPPIPTHVRPTAPVCSAQQAATYSQPQQVCPTTNQTQMSHLSPPTTTKPPPSTADHPLSDAGLMQRRSSAPYSNVAPLNDQNFIASHDTDRLVCPITNGMVWGPTQIQLNDVMHQVLPDGVYLRRFEFDLTANHLNTIVGRSDLDIVICSHLVSEPLQVCHWPSEALRIRFNDYNLRLDRSSIQGGQSAHKVACVKHWCRPGRNQLEIALLGLGEDPTHPSTVNKRRSSAAALDMHRFAAFMAHMPALNVLLDGLKRRRPAGVGALCELLESNDQTYGDTVAPKTPSIVTELNLTCPVFRTRMMVPGRITGCEHVEAFDMEAFLRREVLWPRLNCPICGHKSPAGLDGLCIDTTIQNALRLVHPAVTSILVRSDGCWRLPPPLSLDLPADVDQWQPVIGPLTELVSQAFDRARNVVGDQVCERPRLDVTACPSPNRTESGYTTTPTTNTPFSASHAQPTDKTVFNINNPPAAVVPEVSQSLSTDVDRSLPILASRPSSQPVNWIDATTPTDAIKQPKQTTPDRLHSPLRTVKFQYPLSDPAVVTHPPTTTTSKRRNSCSSALPSLSTSLSNTLVIGGETCTLMAKPISRDTSFTNVDLEANECLPSSPTTDSTDGSSVPAASITVKPEPPDEIIPPSHDSSKTCHSVPACTNPDWDISDRKFSPSSPGIHSTKSAASLNMGLDFLLTETQPNHPISQDHVDTSHIDVPQSQAEIRLLKRSFDDDNNNCDYISPNQRSLATDKELPLSSNDDMKYDRCVKQTRLEPSSTEQNDLEDWTRQSHPSSVSSPSISCEKLNCKPEEVASTTDSSESGTSSAAISAMMDPLLSLNFIDDENLCLESIESLSAQIDHIESFLDDSYIRFVESFPCI